MIHEAFLSQFCQLIHKKFDIVGILRDKMGQSIHNYSGYLEKKGRLEIHY